MNNLTLQAIATPVLAASGYVDIFGLPPDAVSPAEHVKKLFRKLQRDLHPDRYVEEASKQLADEAFKKVALLHEDALRAIRMGQYGKPAQLVIMKTPSGSHAITRVVGSGDLSATYWAESKVGVDTRTTFVKVVKDHRNNDLMKTEARALKILHGPDVEQKWRPYVSELVESFVYAEAHKPRRRTNVLTGMPDFISMEDMRPLYPNGVPVVHVVWMWRRVLMSLGFAHDNQVIHGAVLPPHVMILPEHHGVTLVDWCYASIATDSVYPSIVAVPSGYKDWYPEEVLSKQAPSPATDLYLAAKTMIFLFGGDPLTGNMPNVVPFQLRAFFRGCLQLKQTARPQNAWLLLQEFDELLERIGGPFYPRKFRTFVLPTGTTKH